MNILKAPTPDKLREFSGIRLSVEQPRKAVGLILLVLTFFIPMFVLPFAYVISRQFRAQGDKDGLAELAFVLSSILTILGVIIAVAGLYTYVVLPTLHA